MNVSALIDGVIIGFGIYFIVLAIRTKKKGQVPSVMLAEEELKKCKDQVAFVKAVFPSMLACGIAFLAVGVMGLVNDLKLVTIPYGSYICLILFLVVFAIYYITFRNARMKYC